MNECVYEILDLRCSCFKSKARYHFPEGEELTDEHIHSFILNLGVTPTDPNNEKKISQEYLPRLVADVRILHKFM